MSRLLIVSRPWSDILLFFNKFLIFCFCWQQLHRLDFSDAEGHAFECEGKQPRSPAATASIGHHCGHEALGHRSRRDRSVREREGAYEICELISIPPGPGQDPVLVLPHTRVQRLPSAVPTILRPSKTPPTESVELWLELAQMLLTRMGNTTERAARYLLALSRGERGNGPLTPLPWHERAQHSPALLGAIADVHCPVVLREMWPAAQFVARVRR